MNKEVDFVFKGVKYFSLKKLHEYFRVRFPRHVKYLYSANVCRCMWALSYVLATMDRIQPDIFFHGKMFVNVAPIHSNFS